MKKVIALAIMAVSFSATTFAQDTTKIRKHTMDKVSYSCPMHPGKVMYKPGKCAECGMDLVAKTKKAQMKMEVMKMYACPMHPKETSDKAGKCTKCGMDLVKKDK